MKYFCLLVFFLLLFLGASIPSIAQEISESVHFHNYTINDGLPSNETYDVFQDSKGFLWIGTDNGVVRYDGQVFKTFTTLDGLTDNTIFKITEDYLGRIWFMTYNRKLCYYENGKFKEYWYNDALAEAGKKIYNGYTITNFVFKPNGSIELTFVDFLYLTISSNGIIQVNQDLPNNYSLYIHESSISKLISILSPSISNKRVNKFIVNNKYLGKCHFIQSDEFLFVGSKAGLDLFSKDDLVPKHILDNRYVTGVTKDFEGGVWCSTLYSGIIYIPNFHLSHYKITANKKKQIHSILNQESKLIFCYGKNDNYLTFNTTNKTLIPYPGKLNPTKVFNKNNSNIKFENPLYVDGVHTSITSMIQINKDLTLYATNKKGLIYTDKSKLQKKLSMLNHLKLSPIIHTDVFREIWDIYNDLGIVLQRNNHYNCNFKAASFTSKVTKLLLDTNKTIWIASTEGLFTFDPITEEVTPSKINFHSNNQRIQDINQSNDSTLFFATKARGIYIWKDSVLSNLNVKTGLLSNTIYQLVYEPENNRIWATGNNGISVLNQNKNEKWIPSSVITNYDGLKSKDIRQIAIQDGQLYFANNNGISRIALPYLFKKLPAPILYLQDVIVNAKTQPLTQNLEFPYDSNNVQIEYHAISYKSLNDVQYQYQILPIDTLWRTTKNGHFNFQALIPNHYNFRIRAINIDGIKSDIKEFHFVIHPAFWMTIWFQLGVILVGVYLVFLVSMKSIRYYKGKAVLEKSLNELRVISLQSKMSPHFIFNSLNSIQNYILKNEKQKANDYLLEFSKLIRVILQNSDETSILLNKELNTLQMYMNLEMKRLRNTFNYRTDIDGKIDLDRCKIPSLLLQPFVENSIWHGKVYNNPEGEIYIQVKLKDSRLYFEISDNGIGIENAEKSKVSSLGHSSMGSQVTRKRIELLSELNQQLSEVIITKLITHNEPTIYQGTRVTFSIPYEI